MIAPARNSETRAGWGQGTKARTLRFKLRRVGWSEQRHGDAVLLLLQDALGRLPTVASQQVALQIALGGPGHDSAAAAQRLGSLTDAFVVVRPDAVIAVRGGAAPTRLFLRQLGQDWLMTDTLDEVDADQLRSDWLAFFLANAVQGPFEPRATLDTVFNSVHRIPPASVVELRADRLTRHEILHDDLSGLPNDTDELRHALADTIVATLSSAVDATPPGMAVAYELSGGLDSTSVALASQAAAQRAGRQRVANSIIYPYFEFRRERYFIDAAARALGLTSRALDGSELLPFDHWYDMPPHDEPSLAAVGFAQHRAMLAAAAVRGAGVSFHGFGGDTIFGMGPARQFSGFGTQLRPTWLGKRGWLAVSDHLQTVRAWFGDGESGFHRQYFSGAHIDDGWADVVVAPRLGCPRVGGFTHPDVLRLTATLWPRQAPGAAYKQILRDLFAAQLPAELLSRPHKVAYDGLYVRGYRRHRTRLEQLIARHAETLARADIDPHLLLAALDKVCSGHLEGDQPLGTVLAALVWMDTRT
ncbi:asparagine synthase-related protein [Aquabacterium sp. UBA2148]|uniref:asparagine synthase-related protein n=1 Tax=Aquabacterium sp. UBA2148 TaxID=1946042 RepID=UPI00257A3BA0|nr:asparagine synthase-related protein [Aquabacterium sp. UBA2148]